MNLKMLIQLNKDTNGAVIDLLAGFENKDHELCFYDKGILPGPIDIDDFEGELIGDHVEYAAKTLTPDFYSMLGVCGRDYSFEVGVFDDGRANEVDGADSYITARILKDSWVPARAIIHAIPELFLNITQCGERDEDYKGTFYHDLGISWEVNGPKLLLDKSVLEGVIRELEIAEEEADVWYYAAGCGVPSRFAI